MRFFREKISMLWPFKRVTLFQMKRERRVSI